MTRLRSGIAVVAVVLLVALAGCTGGSGSGTPTANATENGTATGTDTGMPTQTSTGTDTGMPTQTATPTDNTGDDSTGDDSTGDDSTGDDSTGDDSTGDDSTGDDSTSDAETNITGAELDGAALNNATTAAIQDAGSYTLESNTVSVISQSGSTLTERSDVTVRVDLDANRGFRLSNRSQVLPQFSQSISVAVFTDGETSYQRLISNRGTNYSMQQGETGNQIRPVNTSNADQNLTFLTDGLVWQENGTDTVDGTTVTRYSLAGVTNATEYTGSADATLSAIGGSLAVDDDDAIRSATLNYTIESSRSTSQFELDLSLTDFGSTTVSEPGWTAQAEQSS